MLRTHHLGQITEALLDKPLTVCGWVDKVRDVGGIQFIVLRDRYGHLQLSCNTSIARSVHLGREFCIQARGILKLRPAENRHDVQNGQFELELDSIQLLNKSEIPPFLIDSREDINEELRLKYRYLDLRRAFMRDNLIFRHKVVESVRRTLNSHDFVEVETPMMMKSTPEGARDFLVPSRVYPGQFFALPQSPQLYKQMLQVASFDRYYQLAKCFRDEDSRKDRQMVHTQIDLEMSFVDEEDVFFVVEDFVTRVFKDLLNVEIKPGFLRISHDECIRRFGLDKPDLRFDLEIIDLNAILAHSTFPAFQEVLGQGGRIGGLLLTGGAKKFSRKDLDGLTEFVKTYRSRTLYTMKMENGAWTSGIAKQFSASEQAELTALTGAKEGDLLVFVAERRSVADASLGWLRNHLARLMDLIPENQYRFLWVTDFPAFEFNEDSGVWDAKHHMFCAPKPEHMEYLISGQLEKVYARLYDLVLNGVELGSGSIRIWDAEVQKYVMRKVGLTEEQIENRFGFFLRALQFGAPPHGGIALGLDRFVMTLLQCENIRDVMAFPNAASSRYLLDDSPTEVSDDQLRELHLRLRKAT